MAQPKCTCLSPFVLATLAVGVAGAFMLTPPPLPATPVAPLNSTAASDSGLDGAPNLIHLEPGRWLVAWHSTENLGGAIGADYDIFRSAALSQNEPPLSVNWSPVSTLNSTAASDGNGNDRVPTVARDLQGRCIAVWESNFNLGGTIGNEFDLFFSRSSDGGVTWSPVAVLNTNAASDSGADYEPHIATDGAGLWIVVWRSLDSLMGAIGVDADVLFSRSADFGSTWSAPAPLNTNAASDTGHDIRPRLATDAQGTWIAVWQSSDTLGGTLGSDYDILFSRSINGGVTWSSPQPLNSHAPTDVRDDTDPAIAVGNATWIVVWSSEDSLGGTIGIDRDILYSRSTNGGVTWSPAAPLHANASTDAGHDHAPALATDGQGRWAVVWHSSESAIGGSSLGTDFDILMSYSQDDGLTWSPPQPLNSNAAADSGADEWPTIATDSQGIWLVAWESRDTLGGTIGPDADLLFTRFALPDCNLNMIPDSAEIDCNRNGIPDDCDIAAGTSPDVNGNGIPDECEKAPLCPADIAPPGGDGQVNVNDLLAIINAWGPCPAPPQTCPADIAPPGGDGIVNVNDLLAVINAWGPCPTK
jgi:hypothetical protein